MRSSRLKRSRPVLVVLALAVGVGAAPQISRLPLALAQTAGSSSVQCPSLFGAVPTPLTVSLGSTPAGSAAAVPALECRPVSSSISTISSATLSVSLCGTVTDFTAPVSGGPASLTVNGLIIPIPAGYAVPGYVAVGNIVYVVILSPGGQLVEISPGFCTPLAAATLSGGGGQMVGKAYAS